MVLIVGYMGAIPNFSEEAEVGDLFQLFKDTQKKGSLLRAGLSILSLPDSLTMFTTIKVIWEEIRAGLFLDLGVTRGWTLTRWLLIHH
ncbi:unnamed protein product [Clonostachys rhizophaga]|uniref:Uncharacterized protein n=1 Tax=Clonostachys rhizophaga TaxID=160324 RepID=A0A9N9YG66_9HYPO|nr:unnamed protein product [Clonostachys rhizophaga]